MALGPPNQTPGVPPPSDVDHLTPEAQSPGTPRQATAPVSIVSVRRSLRSVRGSKICVTRPGLEGLLTSGRCKAGPGNVDGAETDMRNRKGSDAIARRIFWESADTRSFGGKHLTLFSFCIPLGNAVRFSFLSRISNQFRDNIGSRNTCAARFGGCVVD